MTIIYSLLVHYVINNIGLSSDEGCYMMAAKQVISGRIPYRDFGYTQTPMLPYINGFFMNIFGFGQQVHRVINACWGYLALILSIIIVFNRKSYMASFMCGWVLVTSPFWVGLICFSPYGVSTFFMTLTGLVICSMLSYSKKVALFSVFGNLAIACRLTVAPAIIILLVYLIIKGTRFKQRVAAIVSFLVVGMIIFLPFYFASPDNFIFWNLGYHLHSELKGSMIHEHIFMFPSIFIMICLATPIAIIMKKKVTSPEVIVLLAATVGIITQMVLKINYGVYSTPFVTLCVMGGSLILADFKWNKYIYAIFIIFPLIYMTPLNPIKYLTISLDEYLDKNWVNTLSYAESFLRENTSVDGYLLTPFPVLAVQADRRVFEGIELGMFSITDEMDEIRAKKLHLMHYDELIDIVKDRKAQAVILNNFVSPYNFSWSVPSITLASAQKSEQFFDLLKKNYKVVFNLTPLVILLPK
jgi:hypothetical protein